MKKSFIKVLLKREHYEINQQELEFKCIICA